MRTIQGKLVLNEEQTSILKSMSNEYISTVNDLVQYISRQVDNPNLTTSRFYAQLPSAVKNECIRAAKSVWTKYQKGICGTLPMLKKEVITWNNQNYRLERESLTFPVMVDGKSRRIRVKVLLTDYQRDILAAKVKPGGLRITRKNGKWIAQIAVEEVQVSKLTGSVMGVDLGIKVPAVAVTEDGLMKFFGNGRQNKQVRRKHQSRRRSLGKAKKKKAIQKLNNKEQRWMRDRDHKISREIVNHAIQHEVSTIHMEQLQNIRTTARTSRKNNRNLHNWSFHRLSAYIEYKARMAGIEVEYVHPQYTSQTCPACGQRNKVKDRQYSCACGYMSHRDIVGAKNIIQAPVASGNRRPA